ncbi:rho family small GTPase [Naegleria gruberi]|uniref:Rho family small GTPase n=1 Tax=Naegleria gruberi TaxID=5762 RepID=D2VN47_NAEGR|nr:rho family small GTPase [Naegleria gruberi]EFC41679.1 rho family small GTPase [Naegleria gruberi]|eukprot:XP_002674423.1 rho family small GTPase [Naegleria gruberi strain NEG-M]
MESIKCVVVGDGAVGKTALLIAYSSGCFPEDYVPTVFDNYNKNISYGDGIVSIALYDTAGQEDYDRLRPLSYPDTDVFLVCFSLENPNSLENCQSKWAEELKHYNPDTPIVLVGTKLDLKKDEEYIKKLKDKRIEPVTSEQGNEMKDRIKASGYIECSAKTMENLADAFDLAVGIAMKQKLKDNPQNNVNRPQKKKCQIL